MKRMIKLTSAVVTLALLAACGDENQEETENGAGEEESTQTLRVGSTGQSYPNGYMEEGELVGFDVDVANTIAENLGYEIEWETGDFSGIMAQLESGRLDTVANAVAITEEREETYYFAEPYSFYGSQIVTHEDNDEIETLEDLKGNTVSGVLGSNHVAVLQEFDPEIEVRTYETRDGAMQDAVNNRVEGYINSRPILIAEIEQRDLPLKLVEEPFHFESVSFPFADDEEGRALADEFSAEIEALRESGELAEISERYYGEDITTEEE